MGAYRLGSMFTFMGLTLDPRGSGTGKGSYSVWSLFTWAPGTEVTSWKITPCKALCRLCKMHNETGVFLEGVEYKSSIRICGPLFFFFLVTEKNTPKSLF